MSIRVGYESRLKDVRWPFERPLTCPKCGLWTRTPPAGSKAWDKHPGYLPDSDMRCECR